MVGCFSSCVGWNNTGRPLARGGCVETCVIPRFRGPSAFASFPIPPIPLFFLPLTLLLLLVFYERQSHSLHYHKLRGIRSER